jgi:hypothetical protein
MVGVLGQILAVQRHYIGYSDLLKIRYSPLVILVIVGTEDRLVRQSNSYMLQRVSLFFLYLFLLFSCLIL